MLPVSSPLLLLSLRSALLVPVASRGTSECCHMLDFLWASPTVLFNGSMLSFLHKSDYVKSHTSTTSDMPLVHPYDTTTGCLCFFSYHRTAVFREGKLLLPTRGDPSFIPSQLAYHQEPFLCTISFSIRYQSCVFEHCLETRR